MMGPAHSLSGAAAWLGVGAAAAAAGHPMPWPVLLVGALICAGAALAPDLDHKAATISRAFGPVSRGLCEIVDKLSYAVYKATRKQGDPRRTGGHRTLTHTWLWAVLIGAGASAARDHRWPLGGAGASSSCTWCSPSKACCGGRPVAPARRPGLAAGRDQCLDPRRCPGQAGQRLGLAVHRPGPAVPVARPADRAGRAGARHRGRADGVRLPGPVAHPDRPQALVPDRPAEGACGSGRGAGSS